MASTSQGSLMDPEDLIECPFDKTHMIRAKRFQYHVTTCAKNFPNHNMKKCPFNARHWVPKPHFTYHISTCADRRTIETETEYQNRQGRIADGTYFGGNVSVPSYDTQYAIDETENWDDEATSAPFVWGSNNNDPSEQRNTAKHEPVFVHPCESRMVDQEIRLPKHRPEVLQNMNNKPSILNGGPTNTNAGYGRGSLVAKAREDKQTELLQSMGRGRGKNIPGMPQYRSLSEVMGPSPNRKQQSPTLTNNTSSQHNSPQLSQVSASPAQWTNGYDGPDQNRVPQQMSHSPYSSGSESNIPAEAKKHAGQGVPRSVNLNSTNRFSPNTSRDNSPKPSPAHSSSGSAQGSGVPSWLARGGGGSAGIGRGSGVVAIGRSSQLKGSGQSSVGSDTPSPASGGGPGVGRGVFKHPEPVTMTAMRGIGRGAIRTVSVPIPGVRPLQEKGFDSTGSNSPCSQSDSEQFESEFDREKLKDERKIRKKLKQIEALESRQDSGDKLTPEELQKLTTKPWLITQMEDMKLC